MSHLESGFRFEKKQTAHDSVESWAVCFLWELELETTPVVQAGTGLRDDGMVIKLGSMFGAGG